MISPVFRALAFVILALSVPAVSNAGFVEIGASGSYRKSNIDVDAYDESISITATLAYYFSEATALEMGYTDGQNKRVISENIVNGHVTSLYYKTLGLDFIYTIGPKEAIIRPYLKAGVNYIISKRIVDQYRLEDGSFFAPTPIEDDPGLVPSGGFGFRLGLTQQLSMKVGVDGWTSRPLNKPPVTIDWFGRAGLSWLF